MTEQKKVNVDNLVKMKYPADMAFFHDKGFVSLYRIQTILDISCSNLLQ